MSKRRELKWLYAWTVLVISVVVLSLMLAWLFVSPVSAQTGGSSGSFTYDLSSNTVEEGGEITLDLSLWYLQEGENSRLDSIRGFF